MDIRQAHGHEYVIGPVLPSSADSVEKLRTLFHAAIEGVISARRVLSNKLSVGKYQSNALSCTVDFAGQSFSTQSVEPGSTGPITFSWPCAWRMSVVVPNSD
jgi:hypothetical protein